jgi:ketosteroid isomerase-like protein
MSQQNVEIVRRFYAEFNRGGMPELDTLDPAVVWYQPDEIFGGEGSYHGHEGVLRAVDEMRATFDEFQAIPDQFIEVGSDRVLVLARHGGIGRGSGARVDAPVGHVVTLRNAKVIEWRAYLDRADALEAVGLSEQDAHAHQQDF